MRFSLNRVKPVWIALAILVSLLFPITCFSDFVQVGAESQTFGNGFVVDKKGCVLTASHVLSGLTDKKHIYIQTDKQDVYQYFLYKYDLENDLALICPVSPPKNFALVPVQISPRTEFSPNERFTITGYNYSLKQWATSVVSFQSLHDLLLFPSDHRGNLLVAEYPKGTMTLIQGYSGAAMIDKDNKVVGMLVIRTSTSLFGDITWSAVSAAAINTFITSK